MNNGLLHGWGGPSGRSEAKLPIAAGAGLDIGGGLAVRGSGIQNLQLASGTNTNVNLPNNSWIFRATISSTITGFTGGYDGRMIMLMNGAAGNVTLACMNGNAQLNGTAIMMSGGQSSEAIQLAIGDCAWLIYDSNARDQATYSLYGSHWKVLSRSGINADYAAAGFLLQASTGASQIGSVSSSSTLSFFEGNGGGGIAGQALMSDGSSHAAWSVPMENDTNVIAAECFGV